MHDAVHALNRDAGEFVSLQLESEASGSSLEVTKPQALVGRHSLADLRLPMPEISRRHCRLEFDNGLWRVVDLNSANGVFVNGERVQEACLHGGDRLQLGGASFRVRFGAAPSAKRRAS